MEAQLALGAEHDTATAIRKIKYLNNVVEGVWRVMKEAIGAGRCLNNLQLLYKPTRQVLMAHQERPINEFHC